MTYEISQIFIIRCFVTVTMYSSEHIRYNVQPMPLPPITLPSSFELRPLSMSDYDRIAIIEAQVFPKVWKQSSYKYELSENTLATYEAITFDDFVIGYVGFWAIADELHISIIGVDPQWQGKAVGALLMLSMLHHTKRIGSSFINLEVRRGNLSAQKMYQRFGFKVEGVRKGYYKDTKEDALIMTRMPLDEAYWAQVAVWQEAILQKIAEIDIS